MGPWLHCPAPNPGARLRLVCLPYAGGDTTVYWPWGALLGEDVELWCAQLPGRGRRFTEPAWTDLAQVVDRLAGAVRAAVRPPHVLFGHSMGALLGFELARVLGDDVARLVLSSAGAPHLAPAGDPHLLDDAALVAWMTDLGGAPEALLADPELLDLVLPTLRADLALCAGYRGRVDPVDVPITVVTADADPLVPVEHAAAWRDCTTSGFDLVVRPGGHFHLHDDPAPVLAAVRAATVKEGAQ